MQFATNSVLHIATLRCLIQSLLLLSASVIILTQPRSGTIQRASFYRGGPRPAVVAALCSVFLLLPTDGGRSTLTDLHLHCSRPVVLHCLAIGFVAVSD